MSAICQNTSLDSPLQNVILYEAFDHVKKIIKEGRNKPRARNSRVTAIAYDLLALNRIIDLPENPCSFIQNLSGYYNVFNHRELPGHVLADWRNNFNRGSILSAAKMTVMSHGVRDYQFHKSQISRIESHDQFPTLLKLYYWKWVLEQLVIASARPKSVTGKYKDLLNPWVRQVSEDMRNPLFAYDLNQDVTLVSSSSFFFIQDTRSGSDWLVSREHLLQLADTATQRFLTLFTSIFAEISDDSSIPLPHLLIKVFNWGDDIISMYGNQAYMTIKLWEPLITSYLLNFNEDEHVNQQTFRRMITQDFLSSQGDENIPSMDRFMVRLDELIAPYAHSNPDILSQLFGLYRIWGHPTVDGLQGIRKLKELVRHHHCINQDSVILITRKWREYFSLSYYQHEGRWPVFDPLTFESDNFLTRTLKEGHPLDQLHPEYDDHDWDNVIFGQTFQVPERFELSELISDKATSLDLDELKERSTRFHDIGLSKDRSVIIRWLRSNYQDPLTFLTDIGEHGFNPNTRVAGVYPKEREGKNAPRLFGLMPLQRRLYIVITEALIADFILKYFPEITMTYDQSSLLTRLHGVTKKLSDNKMIRSTPIVTNIDFEKWNSNMREEETIQIFTDFDRLFGLKRVFSRSHELFSECKFYLADGSITPEWDENGEMAGVGVWDHHLGGIEGLRQKGWTVFTAVILKHVCDWKQIRYQLLGQGDNQVLITHYFPKSHKTISDQHTEFLENLHTFLNTIGPPMKLEESWSSSNFFTYGKFPLLKGVPLSMSLKRISRCGHLNNQGIPSLDSILSSITANTASAIAMSKNPITPLVVSGFETYNAVSLALTAPMYGPEFLREMRRVVVRIPTGTGGQQVIKEPIHADLQGLLSRPENLALMLCWIPSALGGFPVFQATDTIMHGFPDPVSLALWECKSLYHALPDSLTRSKTCLLKALCPIINGNINEELLCQSPTSLNLVRGSRPEDQVKRMVMRYLPRIPGIINEAFLYFLEQSQEDQKPLARALFSMTPLHPRIMASIYESTPTGVAQSITRKLQGTKTLELMMNQGLDEEVRIWGLQAAEEGLEEGRRRPKYLTELSYRYEINQLSSLLLIFNRDSPPQNILHECSTAKAKRLREESWQTEIKGVTVAVPMELISPTLGTDCRLYHHANGDLGYIRCQTSWTSKIPVSSLNHQIGPFKPFYGSKTEEKVKYEGGRLVSVAPPMMKIALKNLRLINWGTLPTSNLATLITSIFSHITDANWRLLVPQPGNVTGTLEHRWSDSRTDHSVSPSINYTTSTHFTVNTNAFKPELLATLQHHDNVNINHQGLFSFIAAYNRIQVIYKDRLDITTHWHITCTDCIQEVDEEMIDIPDGPELEEALEVYAQPNPSPYAWIPGDRLIQNNRQEAYFPVVSGTAWRGDWNLLFPLSVSNWFLTCQPTAVSDRDHWKLEESQILLPVSIAIKSKAEDIFPVLSDLILIQYILRRMVYWNNRTVPIPMSYLIQTEISKLLNLPSSWFTPLTSIFLTNSLLRLIETQMPHVSAPKNCPPTIPEKTVCIKSIISEYWYRRGNQIDLRSRCETVLKIGIPRSTLLVFHPEVLSILSKFFKEHAVPNQYSGLLSQVKDLNRTQGYEDKGNELSYLNEILKMHPEKRWIFSGELIHPRAITIVDVSPDFVARNLSKRAHPTLYALISETFHPISIVDVSGLPRSCSYLRYDPTVKKRQRLDLLRRKTTHPISAINHLYKEALVVTTAPYKLLSCLNFLLGRHAFWNVRINNILCCGDGTGGYTAVLSQVFKTAKVQYNSFYQISNQSSVGCDRFIPAAMVSERVQGSRIQGIPEVIEGISDLQDSDIVDQFLRIMASIDMIVCDAEGGSPENIQKLYCITNNLLAACRRGGTKIFIIKSYLSRSDLVIGQLHMMSSIFRKTYCIRSWFSNYGNTEVFLIGHELRESETQRGAEYDTHYDSISLTGDIPSPSEVGEIIVKLQNIPTTSSCKEESNHYSRVLRLPNQVSVDSYSWVIYLKKIMELESRIFPQDLVRILKEEYSLVKFNPHSRTMLRKHLLTSHVAEKLCIHYLIWCLIRLPSSEMIRFEQGCTDLHFIVYETISWKWSMTIRKKPQLGKKTKSWKLGDLLSPQSFKHVYSAIRETKRFEDTHGKILWKMSGADEPPFTVKYVTDFPDWKARIGFECAPMNQLPMPGKNQTLHITAGIAKQIQKQLPDRRPPLGRQGSELIVIFLILVYHVLVF